MDTEILAQLDTPIVNEAIALATAIQQGADEFQKLKSVVDNAAQAINALPNDPSILTRIKSLVGIGEKIVGASESLQSIATVPPTMKAKIKAVRDALPNAGASLTAPMIQGLEEVITGYERVQQLRSGEVESLKSFLVEFATGWLNTKRKIGDGTITFTTAIATTSPFSSKAKLSAVLDYGVIEVVADDLFFTVEGPSDAPRIVPDFSQVTTKVNTNLGGLATSLANEIASNLPAATKVEIRKITRESPPKVELHADFAGLPVFSTLSFGLDVRIGSDGKAEVFGASGSIPAFFVPIPGTVMALSTISIDVQSPGPALLELPVSTRIVPAADQTGATIALSPLTVRFPFKDLENGITFEGSLSLSGLECGKIGGRLSPQLIQAFVQIPTADGPFGGKTLFELDGSFQIDADAIRFPAILDPAHPLPGLNLPGVSESLDVTVTYLSAIRGRASAEFRFDGSGFISANGTAFGNDVKAIIEAEWKSGFRELNVAVGASVRVDVRGFKKISATALIKAEIRQNEATASIKTKILGIPIDLTFHEDFESKDLVSLIEDELKDEAENIGKLVAEQCKKLMKDVKDQLKDALDSFQLEVFTLGPLLNEAQEFFDEGAQELKKAAEKAVDAAKKKAAEAEAAAKETGESAEEAFNKGVETVKGWAKKAPRVKFSLIQDDAALDPGAVLPPVTGILPNFNNVLDAFLDKLSLVRVANKLRDRLLSDSGQMSEKKPDASLREVDTGFDVTFDQIVVGADEIDHANGNAKTAIVAFFLTGTSFTRRRENEVHADFAQWGHVRFFDRDGLPPLASISVSLKGQAVVDASLLHARHRIYAWIRDQIVAADPNVRFGELAHPNGDPNDPGPEPEVDLFFGQPPTQQLPVLADTTMGIKTPAFVAGHGIRIIELRSGGAADKAGLKEGDVVLSVDGVSTATSNNIPDADRDIIRKVLEKSLTKTVVVKVRRKDAEDDDDPDVVTVTLQPSKT